MSFDIKSFFGITGAILLILLPYPQLYITFKTKDMTGVSPLFILVEITISTCFFIYGLLLDDYILYIPNIHGVVCFIILLSYFYFLKYSKSTNNQEQKVYNVELKTSTV